MQSYFNPGPNTPNNSTPPQIPIKQSNLNNMDRSINRDDQKLNDAADLPPCIVMHLNINDFPKEQTPFHALLIILNKAVAANLHFNRTRVTTEGKLIFRNLASLLRKSYSPPQSFASMEMMAQCSEL